MENLDQDSHAVSGFAFRLLTGAVLQPFYDFQCVVYFGVALSSLNIYNGADAAGIMLKSGVV